MKWWSEEVIKKWGSELKKWRSGEVSRGSASASGSGEVEKGRSEALKLKKSEVKSTGASEKGNRK